MSTLVHLKSPRSSCWLPSPTSVPPLHWSLSPSPLSMPTDEFLRLRRIHPIRPTGHRRTDLLHVYLLNQFAAEACMKPVTDFANSLGTLAMGSVTPLDIYYQAIQALIGDGTSSGLSGGGSMAISSRIVPRGFFQGTANENELTSILTNILEVYQDDYNSPISPLAPLLICVSARRPILRTSLNQTNPGDQARLLRPLSGARGSGIPSIYGSVPTARLAMPMQYVIFFRRCTTG
ncbi:hypothetical protein BDW75DRAFT_115184 [Aspergillus navahoensis]